MASHCFEVWTTLEEGKLCQGERLCNEKNHFVSRGYSIVPPQTSVKSFQVLLQFQPARSEKPRTPRSVFSYDGCGRYASRMYGAIGAAAISYSLCIPAFLRRIVIISRSDPIAGDFIPINWARVFVGPDIPKIWIIRFRSLTVL